VPVLDPVPPPAPQPRQPLDALPAVPHLDPVGVDPGLDPLADQPGRDRVRVPVDVDGAAAVHPHRPPPARLQPRRRQGPQGGPVLGQPGPAAGVEPVEHMPQERLVVGPAGEVAAAPEHQGLVDGPLEPVVALLDVPVLVRPAGPDGLPVEAVVPEQRPVPVGERGPGGAGRDGGGQPVGPVHVRDAAQLPQGVLEPVRQGLVTLGEADGPRLPVRVGQHEVVDQVVE
jgi:hypothetical protein